jgi:hypothetical protein
MPYIFEKNPCTAELRVEIRYLDTASSPAAYVPVDTAFMDHMRVALFAPYITPDGTSSDNVKRVLAYNNSGTSGISVLPAADSGYPHEEDDLQPDWTDMHSVLLHNLTPGQRRLYVYGFKGVSGAVNKFGSQLLTLDLKPGINTVTVYLRENL